MLIKHLKRILFVRTQPFSLLLSLRSLQNAPPARSHDLLPLLFTESFSPGDSQLFCLHPSPVGAAPASLAAPPSVQGFKDCDLGGTPVDLQPRALPQRLCTAPEALPKKAVKIPPTPCPARLNTRSLFPPENQAKETRCGSINLGFAELGSLYNRGGVGAPVAVITVSQSASLPSSKLNRHPPPGRPSSGHSGLLPV